MLPTKGIFVPENQAVRITAQIENSFAPSFGFSRNITVGVQALGISPGGAVSVASEDVEYIGIHKRTLTCPIGQSRCNEIVILREQHYAAQWVLNVSIYAPLPAGLPDFLGDVYFVYSVWAQDAEEEKDEESTEVREEVSRG